MNLLSIALKQILTALIIKKMAPFVIKCGKAKNALVIKVQAKS